MCSVNETAATRRTLLSAGTILFLLLGVLQTIYGPALTAFSHRFDMGVEAVSLLVSAHFFGAFGATLLTTVILKRLHYRGTLLSAAALIAAGALIIASSPVWILTVLGVAVTGFGVGLINSGMTVYLSAIFAPNHGPVLNLLNSLFGIGAVAAPLIVSALGDEISLPFYVGALVAFAGLFILMRLPTTDRPVQHANPWAIGAAWPLLAGFGVMYFFYVATEAGVTTWEISHLTPIVGAQQAALYTSLYWGAITIGRFIGTGLSLKYSSKAILLGATVGTTASLGLAHIPSFAPYAYVLVGLFIAPIFANGLAWLAQLRPKQADQLIPLAMAAASLGPVATTPLIAAVVANAGVTVIPTAILLCSAFMLGGVLWLWGKRPVS